MLLLKIRMIIKDFAVLSEFVDIVLSTKSDPYTFAQLSMANHRENGNILVFHYRDRVRIYGSRLTKSCFNMVYGGKLVTKPQSENWIDPFIGISVWDYQPTMPVTKITYPEIKREHFDLVLKNTAECFFTKGFSLDSLVIAKDAQSVGHPLPDGIEKPARYYVLYDHALGFADEHPAIVICKQIPGKRKIESFAKKNNICTHEY